MGDKSQDAVPDEKDSLIRFAECHPQSWHSKIMQIQVNFPPISPHLYLFFVTQHFLILYHDMQVDSLSAHN